MSHATTERTTWATLPAWCSKRDAANHFGLSERTIDRWIESGKLPAFRVGGQVRIKRRDLDAMARPIAPAVVR